MRLIHTAIVPLALALLIADLACQERRGRRRWRMEEPTLAHGKFVEGTFQSPAVGKEIRYLVYLPNGYQAEENKDKKYPLMVWLHGMFEDHQRFKFRGGAKVLDKLVGADEFPETVCVFPFDGTRRSFYINGDGRSFEDMITVDLLAHVDATYRVKKDRRLRAIMGISMGGMGALKIAFKNPGLFGTVATHSAAVFPLDPDDLPARFLEYASRLGLLDQVFGDPIDKKIWVRENPTCLATKLKPEEFEGLRIYFDAGTRDRYGFQESNQLLNKILDKKKVRHEWHLIEGGGHAWGSGMEDALTRSLKFVAETFAMEKAAEAGRKGLKGLMGGGADGKGGKAKSGGRKQRSS